MKSILNQLHNEKVLKWFKVSVFISLLIFLGYIITFKIPLPAAEDLPRQMANGRDILQGNWEVLTSNFYSYTQPDHYFANHHWLYGVLVYISYLVIGWSGMVIFKIIFILATFSLLFWLALKRADFWLVSICSIVTIFMIGGRSGLRPELFGYFFTVLYVYILLKWEEKPDSNLIFWLIPVQILWANIHITWPIGVMLIGAFLFEKIILLPAQSFFSRFKWKSICDTFRNKIIQKLSILLVIIAVVSFLNPLGIKGVIYSLTANIGSTSLIKSSEVQPIFSTIDDMPKWASIPLALVIPIIVTIFISFLIGFRKKQVFYFVLYLGFALLSYIMIRGAPFLGIIFLLVVPANLNDLFVRVKDWIIEKIQVTKTIFEIFLSFVFIIGLIIFFNINSSNFLYGHDVGIGLERNAEDSARFFIDNHITGPIFNDTDIGSYLAFYLYPKEKIYTDNRFGDAYTDEFFRDEYVGPITEEAKWQELLDKYKFNAIFVYQYDQGYNMRDFLYRRINDPEWSFVYGDRFAVILVRNVIENKEVIDKYAITIDNVAQRFNGLTEYYDGYNQVAAADLYGIMGQPALAMLNYAVAVAEHPEWAKIWFTMGKMELQRQDPNGSNPPIALMYLKQAIDRGWKTTNSYSFLALAYFRLGQLDKVEEAVKEELKINPKSEDAQVWLKRIASEKEKLLQKQQ